MLEEESLVKDPAWIRRGKVNMSFLSICRVLTLYTDPFFHVHILLVFNDEATMYP